MGRISAMLWTQSRVDLPTAMARDVVSKGTMGVKSAEMTVKGCPSSATCTQLLMPVLTRRRRCTLPGVRVVSAYFPPAADVMDPLINTLSAVGGPFA